MLSQWRSVLPLGLPKTYDTNEIIFSQGDDANAIFLLASGIVKLTHTSADGEDSPIWLRYTGEMVGDWWAGIMAQHPVTAIAAVRCEVHRLSVDAVRAPGSSGQTTAADIRRQMLQLDLCKFAAAHQELKALSSSALLEQRLWDLAVVLGRSDSPGQVRFVMPLNNTEIANLCGLSESHYKAVRRQLEVAGKLERRNRRIWILHRRPRRLSERSHSG